MSEDVKKILDEFFESCVSPPEENAHLDKLMGYIKEGAFLSWEAAEKLAETLDLVDLAQTTQVLQRLFEMKREPVIADTILRMSNSDAFSRIVRELHENACRLAEELEAQQKNGGVE